jgi:hypothetical protein
MLSVANQEWTLDFTHDVIAAGRNFKDGGPISSQMVQ